MRKFITISLALLFTGGVALKAQNQFTYAAVDSQSYALYQKAAWKELLTYGKQAIQAGQDFLLLRLRLGYAAYMTGNYSESIKHYEAVLKQDAQNATAHYYIYWCRINLNQPEIAMAGARYIAEGAMDAKKLKKMAFTSGGVEVSFKQTDHVSRGNPLYASVSLGNRFSHNFHMEQSLVSYRQKITEPLLTAVNNNRNININQFEYYNRLLFNLGRHWQLKGAYHFLYTPFNNLEYYNHLGLAGVRYYGTYADFQADAVVGRLTDSTVQQYNLQLGLYPMGNLNLYSFSTAMVRGGNNSGFNFREVLGVKLLKKAWLEANITAGEFRNLVENDALYVYNAIDLNKMKAGLTGIFLLPNGLVAQLGYTYELRQLYGRTVTFNQHSITGGLKWKL